MALDYPVSVFVGIDIAPLFPEDYPPNVHWKEKVVKELIRVTKPGGYIEIMDIQRKDINPGIICQKIDVGSNVGHLRKAGINTTSGLDVIEAFNEFKIK
ncbi:5055_t:CDS:2 [Paraglomus brasilianum]|uniref:5055_t:CDS:1 n=1 Tax=Paraglomus brasilianum TaxID=144538 RepID=A0A9N9GJW5_9GLOM|nr:5055_t:CDS:2 [Paraglomus brasilianum]